jgi:hypothetical protein
MKWVTKDDLNLRLPFGVYAPFLAQIIKYVFGSSQVSFICPAKKNLRSATKEHSVTSSLEAIILAKTPRQEQHSFYKVLSLLYAL